MRMSRYWAGGKFGEHLRVRWPISANTTNSSWNTTRYSWNTTNTFPNTTRYYLNTTKVYRNATQFYWNTTQFSKITTQYLRSTKKDLILLLRSAEFVTIQSMNLTFMHHYQGYGGPYLQTQQAILETQHDIPGTQQTLFQTQHGII